MNSPDRRIEDLFHEALSRPVGEREAFIVKATGNETGIQEEVYRLLRAHAAARNYFDPPVPKDFLAALSLLKPEEPGDIIGPYQLQEKIGEGGFGCVWIADQSAPVRRRVALKILKLGMDTQDVIARFDQERQALAMMDHPNIARVFDAGATEHGRPFFVMELVCGTKITEYCNAQELSINQRLELLVQVCHAVQHAHQKGIIHRDLKPSNIIVTLVEELAVPKVIDFGVAKALQGKLSDLTVCTQLEQMIGTPLYMSPEQAEMASRDIDTRSDIYSLGILLYELLTGRTPFDPEELMSKGYDEIRRTIREVDPPRPSLRVKALTDAERTSAAKCHSVDPKKWTTLLHGDVDWIVMKCLEKDRRRRYETASSLALDLRNHLNNQPIAARPPTTGYLVGKLFKRHRLAFVASTLVSIAIVTALVVVLLAAIRIAKEKRERDKALRERGIALESARERERDARENLVRALKDEARARRFSRRMGQRFDALTAVTAAARIGPDEELRDIAIAAFALPDLRRGPSWEIPRLGSKMCCDGHYRFCAFTDEGGNVSIRTIPEGKEIRKIAAGAQTWATALSPNGDYLVTIGANGHLRVWNVADAQLKLTEEPEHCTTFAFTPDSQCLAVAQDDRIVRFDMANGREINRWQIRAAVSYLEFNATGGMLGVGYMNASIASVCDAVGGTILADLPVGPLAAQIVAWHPDGEHVAIGGSEPAIQIWDWASKRRIATLKGHSQNVTALSFHPDGGLLASYSWDGTLRLWEPWSGREFLQTPIQADIHFSVDGSLLGMAWDTEKRNQLLEVASNPEFRSLPANISPGKGAYYTGDFSPDGRLLAMGMGDGVRLWEIATGRQIAHLPFPESRCVLFRPDVRKLLIGTLRTHILSQCSIESIGPSEIRLGPFEPFALPAGSPMQMLRTHDGLHLAIVSEAAGEVVVRDTSSDPAHIVRFAHPRACYLALSPDGRFVASSGWNSKPVRLWDTESGKLLHEWPDVYRAKVFFTPGSDELIISNGESFAFWNVATFERTRRLPCTVALYPGYFASSPDGTLMALEISPGIIELQDAKSRQSLGRLENPFGDRCSWLAFTPNGRELVAVSVYAQTVQLWDLQVIHDRLASIGLADTWPRALNAPSATRPTPRYSNTPLKVTLVDKPAETR